MRPPAAQALGVERIRVAVDQLAGVKLVGERHHPVQVVVSENTYGVRDFTVRQGPAPDELSMVSPEFRIRIQNFSEFREIRMVFPDFPISAFPS